MASSLMSLRMISSRSSLRLARPLITSVGLRYNSSVSLKTPNSDELAKVNGSKLLGAISETVDPSKSAEQDATEWLEAIEQVRKEFTHDGKLPFNPTKAFSPDGETEVNLVQQAMDFHVKENTFKPSAQQQEEFDRVKNIDIPVRSDPVIQYLTNVIMHSGRKARAQRTMSEALYLVHLQTRTDPVQLLKDTLESMAPILKLRRYTDGGARAEMIPVPLNERQKFRQAWKWIIDASDKRGSKSFSVRLAEEIIAASNKSSSGYEKREQLHKAGVAARSFIKKM